jgi:hypothetical protein
LSILVSWYSGDGTLYELFLSYRLALFWIKINKKGQVVTDIVGGVDPFDYTTIASVCMGIFKTKFLEETWYIKFKDDDHWIEARKVDDRLPCSPHRNTRDSEKAPRSVGFRPY